MEMRKVLVVLMVASVASVAYGLNVDVTGSVTGAVTTSVMPGETISVVIGGSGAGGPKSFAMTATPAVGGTISTLGSWLLTTTPSVMTEGSGLKFNWPGGTIGLDVAGDWLKAGFDVPSGAGGGTLALGFSGSLFGETPNGMQYNIVPEPMTVVLLGLGGLFLRRRK